MILVVFRDALIVGGIILSHTLGRPVHLRPLVVSKVNTAAQIILAAAVLGVEGLDMRIAPIMMPMAYAVGATTLASGAAYMVTWARTVAAGNGN